MKEEKKTFLAQKKKERREKEMVMNSRWFVTVASIWIQCSSGASYVFGIYSPVLKSSQNYNQSTLDYIAVFKDIGANAGLLAGLLYSAVVTASPAAHPSSSKKSSSGIIRRISGPWIVITTGAVLCFTGYFSMWLAVTGRIPRPPVPLMCFFMFLASHALTFLNTANVVTAVHNFPDYSGTIVGIIKGFVGISGAVLIQVYQTIFVDKPSSFILMLALLPTSVSLLLMFFVRIHEPTRGSTDEKKHLNRFSLIACLIAGYLMILIILENTVKFGLAARIVTFLILMLGLSSMLGVAIRADLTSDIHKFLPNTSSLELAPTNLIHQEKLEVGKMDAKQNLPVLNQGVDQEFSFSDKRRTDQPLQPNLNLLQAMKTMEFWLLFFAMACGLGSGMATVNNISQIGSSFGYTRIETRTLVSLWSIWNFVGRFGAGFISDYFLHHRGWARPIFMAITLATMGIGHVVIASGLPGALYAGSTLVGVCYGSQWSLMPTITSEVFGVAHLGTIFNTIAIASPIGSYILSVRVVGFIYDKEASSDHTGNTCFGHHCFMLSFVIMAIVSTLGFLISLGLYFLTRRFYKEVIFGRLQHSSTKQQG